MSRPATPSTSNGNATGAAALAPVVAPQGPVMQINHKKVPIFHGEKDKDTLTVIGWCNRIDAMKTSLGWSDKATYWDATPALFGNPQRIADNWAVLYKAEHRKTRAYLKKAIIKHWGNMQDSRSFIDPCSASVRVQTPLKTLTPSKPKSSTPLKLSGKLYPDRTHQPWSRTVGITPIPWLTLDTNWFMTMYWARSEWPSSSTSCLRSSATEYGTGRRDRVQNTKVPEGQNSTFGENNPQ